MKKLIILIPMLALCLAFMGAAEPEAETGAGYGPVATMDAAHEIAEIARGVGLAEDSGIITEATKLWWEAYEQFCADRDIIATVIYNEAWGGCSERHRELVAAVVVNRMEAESFPGSVYDVVVQPNQYHPAYAQAESFYGRRARADAEAWAECQRIAAKALHGDVECEANVLYQAEFRQGSGVYEVCRTFYSTTYFCYG